MRGTVPGTARRFWAGLFVYAFTFVFGFMIDRPNRHLSSTGNIIDIAHLDDLDDPDGLNPFLVLSAGMRLEGLATSQCIASGSVIAGWHAHLSALASRAGKGVHLRIRAHRNAASVLHRYQRKRLY
jgi:hypothetical protein